MGGGIQAEARQALNNITDVLHKTGSSIDNVVKCTVFMADMSEWSTMNDVYVTFFPSHKPTRSAFGATGLALNANSRLPLFPDIPTLAEATGEDYPPPWFGLFAPAGTPLPIVDKMHDEVARIASVPDWRQRNFVERAVEPAIGPRDEFIKFIASNRAFAAKVAKEAGIQPQ